MHGLYQRTTTATSSSRQVTCVKVPKEITDPAGWLKDHYRRSVATGIEISLLGPNDNFSIAPMSARAAG
jgi:hypothetical protein